MPPKSGRVAVNDGEFPVAKEPEKEKKEMKRSPNRLLVDEATADDNSVVMMSQKKN